MRTLLELLVKGVGLVLIFAGVKKLRDPYAFLKVLYNYELLSLYFGIMGAAILPWLEIISGIFLFHGIWRQASLVIAITILLGFVATQGFAIFSGLEIACGCFGTQASVGPNSILISTALAIICVLALCRSVKQINKSSFRQAPNNIAKVQP